MKFRILILFFTFLGCNQHTLYKEVFRIDEYHQKVDLGTIQTVRQFDDFYCEGNANVMLVLPYDFENGRLDIESDYGIPVIGNPNRCHPALCCSRAVSIFVKDESVWLFEDDGLSMEALDSLIQLNLLNYGYDPALSDNPDDALFIIRMDKSSQLSKLNLILDQISSSYLRIMEEVYSETNDSVSTLLFPLNLMLTSHLEIPPLPLDSILIEEIEGEIQIDTTRFGK